MSSVLGIVDSPMDFNRHDVAGLVRLRATLEHAKFLATDLSEHGRHVALISLDGAAEYAMWLAVQHLGLPTPERTGFHDTMNKLIAQLGARWQQPGRRGVLQMHTARNQAQHGGATPDPALMDGWTEELDAFASSLVSAAFDVTLQDILLASAIQDESLRIQITEAELAINASETQAGFGYAYDAFVAARRLWRDQQTDAYGAMAVHAPFDVDPQQLDPAQRSTDYADVSVFASDLGEYHWLMATRRLAAEGVPANLEDARRALQFAYHWILRWQTFDARYPRERWDQHFESVSPPSTGDGRTPEIQWVQVIGTRMVGSGVADVVVVQLANLPGRGRDDWGVDMRAAIEKVTGKPDVASADIIPAGRTITGQLTLFVSRELDPEQTASCLTLAVEEATRLYNERREQAERRDAEASAYAAAFSDIFAQHEGLFGAVRARPQMRQDGESVVIAVNYLGSLDELSQIAEILRSHGGHLANTWQADGGLVFDAHELDATNRTALREALTAAEDQVLYTRRFAQEREREREALEQALQSRLGAPPAPVSEQRPAEQETVE